MCDPKRLRRGPLSAGAGLSAVSTLGLALVLVAAACAAPGPTAPTPMPTTALFGKPAPVDPCGLITDLEATTVLGQPFATDEQETSGGDALTCTYFTQDDETRFAITVLKPPHTLADFERRRDGYGQLAQRVEDLGDAAYILFFGPRVTVTALKGEVEFYVDLYLAGRSGGQIVEPALALVERSLSRM